MRRFIIAALAILAGVVPSLAQAPFARTQPTVTLAVTSVSARVAIATDMSRVTTLWICNTGTADANIVFGDSTVVATSTGTLARAGLCLTVSPDGKTNLSAITVSGSTALSITPGSGFIFAAGVPGGGAPASVTATQGTVSHASVTALGTSLVVKASAGTLFGFNCAAITGGAAGYCIAYNGTAAPSTGALTGSLVLDACYFDTTARGCSLGRLSPIAYSAGIVILVTSAATPFTYTTGTDTAFVSADYQ